MSKARTALIAALAVAACARGETAGPSLAPRAIEARGWAEPTIAPPSPAAPDPALAARLAGAREALAANNAGFERDATRAARLAQAAKGAPTGEERWIAAQSALAGLDARRAETVGLVGDLEALALDRARALAPDDPALAALQSTAEAQLARQTARIAALQAMLPAA